MKRNWWIILGTIVSGTALYLLLKKFMKQDEEARVPAMVFGHTEKRRFDDLNRIFDGVDADLEEPWL